MTRNLGPTITAAIMTLIFGTMVALASTYPEDARLLPFVIGIPGLALCVIQLAIELWKRAKLSEPAGAPPENAVSIASEVKYFLWFPAFVASVLAIGFLGTALVMVFLFLRFGQKEPLKLSIIFSVCGTAVIYLMFEILLGLPLFMGFIYEWLIR